MIFNLYSVIKGVNNPMKNKETSAKNADLRKKK
jgi:hypothetical protein